MEGAARSTVKFRQMFIEVGPKKLLPQGEWAQLPNTYECCPGESGHSSLKFWESGRLLSLQRAYTRANFLQTVACSICFSSF